MAFPASPSNGDTHTEDGISYVYDSTLGYWAIGTGSSASNPTHTNIYATGNTTVEGNTTLGNSATDTVTVNATSTFKEPVTIEKTLEVDGDTTMNGAVTLGDAEADAITVNGDTNFKADVDIDKTLNVDGNATLNSNVTLGDAESDIITVKGDTTFNADVDIDKTLNVDGATTLNGAVTLGDAEADAITVKGDTTFKADVDIDKTLNVDGDTTLNGNVDLGNATTDTVSFTARVDTDIDPSADATYSLGSASLQWKELYLSDFIDVGNIKITGNTISATDENGDINISPNGTGKVNITGGSSGTISNTGDLVPSADGTYDLGSTTAEWQDLWIDGTANIDALIADTAIVSDLTDNRIVIVGTSGELEDDANLTYDGTTFTVGGTTNNLKVTNEGNIVTNGTLTVDGATSLKGAVALGDAEADAITVNGDTNFKADVDIDKTLNVKGNGDFDANLNVDGKITLGHATNGVIEGPAIITLDPAVVGNNTGTVVIAGDLTVQGTTTTINSTTVEVADKTFVLAKDNTTQAGADGAGLVVEAGTTDPSLLYDATNDRWVFNKPLEVPGGITTAATTQSGDLLPSTTDTYNIGSSTHEWNNIYIGGTANIDALIADTAIVSDLTDNRIVIVGTSGELEDDSKFTFDGTTFRVGTAAAGLDVTAASGNIHTDGTLTVVGATTLNGAVTLGDAEADAITVNGDTNFKADVDIDKTLNVDGAATFNGAVTLGDAEADAITVNGDTNFKADVDIDKTLNVDGDTTLKKTTVTGTLTVTGQADVDNIRIDGNSITSTNTNGNINITPNGTGKIVMDGADWRYLNGVSYNNTTDVVTFDMEGQGISDLTVDMSMTAATSTVAGGSGLVPKPAAGDQAKVLSGAGTWISIGAIDGVAEQIEDTIGSKIKGGGDISVSYNDTSGETTVSYSHPIYNGDDFDVGGTALTGLNVYSNVDINVTTDARGHVTDANGSLTSRDISEDVRDLVATFATAGAGIDITHDDAANTLTFAVESDLRGDMWTMGRDANDYYTVGTTTHSWFINGNEDMRLSAGGGLIANGDICAFSTTIASDSKLKENIKTIENHWDILTGIRGVTFDMKKTGLASAGVIAQEVEEVMPQAVKYNEVADHKVVDYNQLIGVLIQAVKDLQEEVKQLKGE